MTTIKPYEKHSVAGHIFRFKLDINPITQEYEPHIYHRHLIEPEKAILAFLNRDCETFNIKHQRYEAKSDFEGITIYYMILSKDKKQILIITAFKEA